MKKFMKNIFFYVAVALVALLILALVFQDFYGIFLTIGGGSIIAGMVLTPFVIIGCVNVFRGFGAVLEMDEAKYKRKLEKWQYNLYVFLYVGGYLALFYVMIRVL